MAESKSWITTFLMYPTLIIALFSGLPKLYDFYQSYKLGLPVSRFHVALEQRKLWEKNLACLLKVETYRMKVPDQTLIEVTLCPSGDVLFRHLQPDGTSIYLWLGYDSFKKVSSVPSFISVAGAEVLLKGVAALIQNDVVSQPTYCIKLDDDYVLWEKEHTKSCHFEKIFTYTGESILVEKIDCTYLCQEEKRVKYERTY